MSRDESSLPAATGAEKTPGPGGPAFPPQEAESPTLRDQVTDLINDVLADPDPDREWARAQLRQQLASHPDNPERAFLEHLAGTRRLAAAQHPLPASREPDAPVLRAGPEGNSVASGADMTKRVQSVLGNRLLLTAFQPVRELPDGRVAGFEALTRFVSNDGASADIWFGEAHAVGLGPELEMAALECAVSAAQQIPEHLFVAFNLSPGTFTDARVGALLQNCGLALDRIIIELRGRATDEQWASLIRAVGPLRQRGLRVAVDGSGAGFTPAERILSIRPDIIKVDVTFIDGILGEPDQDEPAVIGLAQEVGAVLAAEGIETAAELAAVIDAGLTAGQGYLLGRPSVLPSEWSAWDIRAAERASTES